MSPTELKEVIFAHGHNNILAMHETTLEITKDTHLSRRGNCIIAVAANKGFDNLSSEFRGFLRKDDAKITITIESGTVSDTLDACGNSKLVLAHPTDMVVRKSEYICNRTLAIQANKAACDLSRRLVEKLKDPNQQVKITLIVKV